MRRGRMSWIGLYVPAAAEWLPDLRAELLAFPTGKYDDIVDALGLVGQLINKFAPGRLLLKDRPGRATTNERFRVLRTRPDLRSDGDAAFRSDAG